MSKLSFRARQVDHTKPLPIYFNNDLPDLQDFAAINRSVPQMPTGMEKEEETEHHLQRILSAQQAFGATSANEYAIPTPKVEIDNKMYERIYNVECPKHKQYIRIQPFSSDFDYPDYDVDYEDEEWINDKRRTLPDDFSDDLVLYFECIMDRLEKATTHSMNLPSLEEAKMLLLNNNDDFNDENDAAVSNPNFVASFPKKVYKKERDEFILCIYDYWKAKRLKYKHPLTPIVLTDKSGVVTQPNNPFLVFRRRTEKMQTRKNRKNEEQSYEKMLILKRDLHRAQQILKLIKKRENIKKEFLKFTAETFEKRFKLNDYDGSLTESIACSLNAAHLVNSVLSSSHVSSATGGSSFSNLSNFGGTHAKSTPGNVVGSGSGKSGNNSIDNKIANLIHSNKLNNSAASVGLKQRLQAPPFNTSSSSSSTLKNNTASQARTGHENAETLKSQLSKNNKATAGHVGSGHRPNTNVSIKTLLDSNQRPLASSSMGGSSPDKMAAAMSLSKKEGAERLSAAALAKMRRQKSGAGGDLDTALDSSAHNYDGGLKTKEFYDADTAGESGTGAAVTGAVDESGGEVEDIESILDETRNKLSTSNEKDGYWCFKRKEGCQYLLQRGSIFKNDIYDHDELFRPYEPAEPGHDSTSSAVFTARPRSKRQHANEEKLDELQRYYYGYAITRKHRHLGLVRRRMGRGGRIVLDRFPESNPIKGLSDKNNNNNSTMPPSADLLSADPNQLFAFDFAAYRTFYPKECFNLNAAVAETEFRKVESSVSSRHSNSSGSSNPYNSSSSAGDSSTAAVVPAVNTTATPQAALDPLMPPLQTEKGAGDAAAFEPPPLKRIKLKFRSSFEDLVQDLNEDDRVNNYYGLDDDSDESTAAAIDDECSLDRFFGIENEKERLFELPAETPNAASLLQFFGETTTTTTAPTVESAVVYNHQRFNDYQMKLLDEKFSSDKSETTTTISAVEPPPPSEAVITTTEVETADVAMSEGHELDDTNFTYELNDTLKSSDQEEEEKMTLEDFFAPVEPPPAIPLLGEKKVKKPASLIQLNLPSELNAEYRVSLSTTGSDGLKRRNGELPVQVAKQAVKTLISMSMLTKRGIEVTVDSNGATESSFKDEDTPQPPAKKKITDPDNLNDIFDSVINNFSKETDGDETTKTGAADESKDQVVVKETPVASSHSNSSDSNSNSSEPVSKPLETGSATTPVTDTAIKIEPVCAGDVVKSPPSAAVAVLPPPTLQPPPPPPPADAAPSSEQPPLKLPLTPTAPVPTTTSTTTAAISSSINSVRLTVPQSMAVAPADLIKLNAAAATTKLTKPLASINSLLNNSSSSNQTPPPMVNGPVASSILSNNSTNNIILNGLIAKRKDETLNYNGYISSSNNNNSSSQPVQQQQESPSSTTAALVVAKPTSTVQTPVGNSCSTTTTTMTSSSSVLTCSPALTAKTMPDAVVSSSVNSSSSSSSSTSSSTPACKSTSLSSHLQMNDNKNYHNLNSSVNTSFNHQLKKNVEAVMSLTSGSNVVSSTTTNENLPILHAVVESTQTSANTDSNKSNVKPMEVT